MIEKHDQGIKKMNSECEIQTTIARIEKMESYFDTIQEIMSDNPERLKNDSSIIAMLDELIDYYENGQWLRDYECDERGELPSALKRGVLSEDGVYNLISDVAAFMDSSDDV